MFCPGVCLVTTVILCFAVTRLLGLIARETAHLAFAVLGVMVVVVRLPCFFDAFTAAWTAHPTRLSGYTTLSQAGHDTHASVENGP